MILWFPDISPDGRRLVGEDPATSGYSCHWLDDARYIGKVGNGPGLRVNNVPAFSDWPEPNAISAGGGGRFACDYWPPSGKKGLRLSDPDPLSPDGSKWILDGFASTMADDGYLAYLTGHDTQAQTVVRDEAGHVYDSGAPMEYPNASIKGVVWTKYTGRDQHSKETWGALRGGAKERLHASGVQIEFGPISVDTPRNGQWVAAFRYDGVVLYPWGSTFGYFYASDNARAVDAKWDPATDTIYVVWNRPDGTLEERRQDLSATRRQLEEVRVQCEPCIEPEPTEPGMTYVRQSPDLTWAIAKCAELFPAEWDLANKKKYGHRTDDFVRKAAPWIAANVDARVGLNGKRGTDEVSHDAMSYINATGPGGVEVIDFIKGDDHTPAWQDVTIPPMPHPQGKPEAPDGVLGKYINPGGVQSPAPATHAYEGGGNDTNECDRIINGAPCMQPRTADIHKVVVPGPGPGPTPGGVKDPRVAAIAAAFRATLAQLEAMPAVVCPPCELPHNPVCELPHGTSGAPVPHSELDEIVKGWARAFAGGTRRIMTPDLTTYLLYRFLFEGATNEQNLAEARERGR